MRLPEYAVAEERIPIECGLLSDLTEGTHVAAYTPDIEPRLLYWGVVESNAIGQHGQLHGGLGGINIVISGDTNCIPTRLGMLPSKRIVIESMAEYFRFFALIPLPEENT